MSTIPEELLYIAGELEKVKDARGKYARDECAEHLNLWLDALVNFDKNTLDDAIKIINDAEERITELEASL